MPGNTSNYWTSMDFGSEDEDTTVSKTPSTRVYVDPWDLENYAFMRRHLETTPEPSSPSSPNGEPASSTFYYVPNGRDYRSEARSAGSMQRTLLSADSPTLFAGIDEVDFHNDNFEMPSMSDVNQGIYYHHLYEDFGPDRKLIVPRPMFTADTGSSLSSGNENYVYTTTDPRDPTSPDASLVYVYETATRKRKIALPKTSKTRSPSQSRPAMRKFRRIRNINCLECRLLENAGLFNHQEVDMNVMPYPMTKAPPENFGLSAYGHLKIDYSCSWHSLDKLISHD